MNTVEYNEVDFVKQVAYLQSQIDNKITIVDTPFIKVSDLSPMPNELLKTELIDIEMEVDGEIIPTKRIEMIIPDGYVSLSSCKFDSIDELISYFSNCTGDILVKECVSIGLKIDAVDFVPVEKDMNSIKIRYVELPKVEK